MAAKSGRYVIVFNGEIYNHPELRSELVSRGRAFLGTSDTEVLLECMDAWGIEITLKRVNGMFALGVWDRCDKVLTLARDRVGEKPLFYGFIGSEFVFASELKALRSHPQFSGEVDREALTAMIDSSYVPSPRSIFKGIAKVPAGTSVAIAPGRSEWTDVHPRPYWTAPRVSTSTDGPEDVVGELHQLLLDAVRSRMIADVPVGAFLSGGIDSSLVASLMQATTSASVHTYSMGFEEAPFDETGFAREVADHLGTTHSEFQVTSADALALVPSLSTVYDEPFGDPSMIPTMLLCQGVRNHVTVALSGDGGDELFVGYRRHAWARDIRRSTRWVPAPVRKMVANGLLSISRPQWDALGRLGSPFGLPAGVRLADRSRKAARASAATSGNDLYRRVMASMESPESLVLGGRNPEFAPEGPDEGDLETMLWRDTTEYLPDDILVKVDRASMAVGLECRVPLLDHRIVEYAAALPMQMKLRNREGKWALRQVLDAYLPRAVFSRPKQGFDVPLAAWLRGPLKEWAGDLLAFSDVRAQGFFDPNAVTRMWNSHLDGSVDWTKPLWNVLMFQAWNESR